MRVRPATPLSVVLFVAFALLLISVLSAPIIQAIPLGKVRDISFGVFGVCRGNSCSDFSIGYDPNAPLGNDASSTFDMPEGVRDTISSILIIHPVAALLTLFMFILAVASHFHAPSHSLRYLLIQFVFTIITFFVSLAAFVIDVLLFIPHMAFGTYFVLAATVLIGLSAVVTCSMRRVLKSRKSQRKMVAENAEMSGENFYSREGQAKTYLDMTPQPSIPTASGANVTTGDVLPTFATFEQRKDATVSDEHVPLRQQSPVSGPQAGGFQDMTNVGEAAALAPARSASRDRYGNALEGPPEGYGVARGPSTESMRSRGSSGYRGGRGGYGRGGYDMYGSPMRGRGGYGGPGRGGYGPRGGRGGQMGTPRGGYGPHMRGGRGPPPGPYGNAAPQDRRPSPAEPYAAYGGYDRRPSDGLNPETSNRSMPDVNAGYEPYNPDKSSYPRAESPPPIHGGDLGQPGQAVPMGTGSQDTNQGYYPQIRDNDSDVAGMVGLQQGRGPERPDTFTSDVSKYSGDEQYMPARAAWNQGDGRNSPHNNSPPSNHLRPMAELPESSSPAPAARGDYYEDVDPRFARQAPSPYSQPPPLVVEPAYDDARANIAGGARSPTGSERSNFTSISQRGINPQWHPPPPVPNQYGPPRRPLQQKQQQRQDMILDNPDFQIPGRRAGGRGPGMVPGSAYPNGAL